MSILLSQFEKAKNFLQAVLLKGIMRVNVNINTPRMQNVYFRANRCTEKCKTGQIAASTCISKQDCAQKEFSYFDFLCKKDKLQISEFDKLLPAEN